MNRTRTVNQRKLRTKLHTKLHTKLLAFLAQNRKPLIVCLPSSSGPASQPTSTVELARKK